MSARLFPRTQRADRLRAAAAQPLLPLSAHPRQVSLPEPTRQQCLALMAELFNAVVRAENHPQKEAADQ
jgi:hypothetical protein